MELGAGKRIILLFIVLLQGYVHAGSWEVGVLIRHDDAVLKDDMLLLSEEAELRSRDFFTQSLLRTLEEAHLEVFRDSEKRRLHQPVISAHHRKTSRANEALFSESAPPEREPLSLPEVPATDEQQLRVSSQYLGRYDGDLVDVRLLHLKTLTQGLDELIIINITEDQNRILKTHFSYLRGAGKLLMLSSRVIEPGNPPESYALPGFSPEQESPRRPEALPLDTAPPVRTIPTYHELIGAGTLYGVISPGYQDAYFSKPASGSVKELLLTPDWVDDIDSQRMRADRFYRSLAGLMISIPLTVIASDMTDSEAGTLFFHTAVSLNITAAVSTLIDLFRYTNYLL